MNESLEYYMQLFSKMNRACVGGYRAPHKIILLLAVADNISKEIIDSSRIFLDDSLLCSFKFLWKRYVDDGNGKEVFCVAEGLNVEVPRKYPFKCDISNPFYHMQHEPFWTLIKSSTWEKKNGYSVAALKKLYSHAEIDNRLFELLKDNNARNEICTRLVNMI